MTAIPLTAQVSKFPGTVQAGTLRNTNGAGTVGQPLVTGSTSGDIMPTNTMTLGTGNVAVVNATNVLALSLPDYSLAWGSNGNHLVGDSYLQYFQFFNLSGDTVPAVTIEASGITNVMSFSGFGTATPNDLSLFSSNSIRWRVKPGGDLLPNASNNVDVGSSALPVRTNWVSYLGLKNVQAPLVGANRLVFLGDSLSTFVKWPAMLTASYLAGFPNPYMEWTNMWSTNFAFSGNYLSNMFAGDYTNSAQAFKTAGGTNAILFAWGGANDLGVSTADNIIYQGSNLLRIARNDGFRTVAFTIGPQGAITTANETKRIRYNDWLRQSELWSWLVDVDRILPDPANTNMYVASDQLHQTDNGGLVIAGAVRSIVHDGWERNVSPINLTTILPTNRTFQVALPDGTVLLALSGNDGTNSLGTNATHVGLLNADGAGNSWVMSQLGVGTRSPVCALRVVGATWLQGNTTNSGHLLFVNDDTYAIGASGANRPTSIFIGSGGIQSTRVDNSSLFLNGGGFRATGAVTNQVAGSLLVGGSSAPMTLGNLHVVGGIVQTNGGIWQTFTFSAPSAPATQGAVYWNDGTNVCVTFRNSAGTLSTNRLTNLPWP